MAVQTQVVLDCADPHAQATFWAAALRYDVEDHTELIDDLLGAGQLSADEVIEVDGRKAFADVAACRDPDGGGPRLFLQLVTEPKTVKNRMHLDLHIDPDTQPAEIERLVGLGATVLWTSSDRGPFTTTMGDPEGNEFCIH